MFGTGNTKGHFNNTEQSDEALSMAFITATRIATYLGSFVEAEQCVPELKQEKEKCKE